jgi:hypothetical protein
MRVIVKDGLGDRESYSDRPAPVVTGSGQLIIRDPGSPDDDTYNSGEWAWYRVEDPEVHDG